MDPQIIKEAEETPGTWAKALKDNWLAFNDVVRMMDDSNGKLPHHKLRDYILWDMKRRHDEETGQTRHYIRTEKTGALH